MPEPQAQLILIYPAQTQQTAAAVQIVFTFVFDVGVGGWAICFFYSIYLISLDISLCSVNWMKIVFFLLLFSLSD